MNGPRLKPLTHSPPSWVSIVSAPEPSGVSAGFLINTGSLFYGLPCKRVSFLARLIWCPRILKPYRRERISKMLIGTGRNANKDDIKNLLRSFIGRHALSTKEAAAITGLGERLIQSHLSHDGSLPNALHMAAYMVAFGAGFTNQFLSLVGQGGASETAPQTICPQSHLIKSTEFAFIQSQILEDGRVTHTERPVLIRKARENGLANFRLAAAAENNLLVAAA